MPCKNDVTAVIFDPKDRMEILDMGDVRIAV